MLAFEGEAQSLPQRDLIRRMLDAFLQGRGILTVDLEWLDRLLSGTGLEPSEDDWIEDPRSLAGELQARGIAYVLVGRDFALTKANAAVAFYDQVSGALDLIDLRSGEVVWTESASSLEYGGVLVESGQVVSGLRHSFDRNTNGQDLRLGVAYCADVLKSWPGFESTEQLVQTQIPEVFDARLEQHQGDETGPPRRTLTVIATADCVAHLLLPDGRRHSLRSVDRGQYRAHFELVDEATIRSGQLVVTNCFGLLTYGQVSDFVADPVEVTQ